VSRAGRPGRSVGEPAGTAARRIARLVAGQFAGDGEAAIVDIYLYVYLYVLLLDPRQLGPEQVGVVLLVHLDDGHPARTPLHGLLEQLTHAIPHALGLLERIPPP
jgi:hypothetical protein